MILLQHLARTGGTLISRCLASMRGVCLLSEINPLGVEQFNPLRQAADWYGIIRTAEVRKLRKEHPEELLQSITLIRSRAAELGLSLVVRDWSHLDFVGFPFVEPALSSSWDLCFPATTGDPSASDSAMTPNEVSRLATVRHPLDQYLSSRRLAVLERAWDERAYWRGVRCFAESVQHAPWFRFEDFLCDPENVLQRICDACSLPYDPGWRERWAGYTHITGDSIDHRRRAIGPSHRRPVPQETWHYLRENPDFSATLDLLGYPTPEPLLRTHVFPASVTAPPRPMHVKADRPQPPLLMRDWDGEVVRLRLACQREPSDLALREQLAQALSWIGESDEALALLGGIVRDCETSPLDVQTRCLLNLCTLLEQMDRRFESIEARRKLAQVAPQNTDNLFQLSNLLAGVGELDEALTYTRQLLTLDSGHTGAAANFLLYTNYSDQHTAAEIANEHFRIGMRFTAPPGDIAPRRRAPQDRIRIGYLASDFYTHPVGKLILPILQSHDRSQFELHLYHDGAKSDANTRKIGAAADFFTSIHGWPDDRLVESLRHDQLNVLVELGGYTGGGNRIRAMSRRMAPTQASFLGYPNTSAVPSIDFHISDRYADPPGETEHLYGERLVWLQHAHLAWHPYAVTATVPEPARSRPLLGLFNNVAKVSPSALSAYASIMRRVPEARLVLKYGDRFGVRLLQDRYRREFAARGVLPHRLEFRTRAESLEQHLATMKSVDLALDSFPYQGTMTSLECLAVGTPIVSCCGGYYAHRATSAMMMRIGLPELVAADPEEYAEIAVQLLSDLPMLRALREEVTHRFHHSPLVDPQGLTRELEHHYRQWSLPCPAEESASDGAPSGARGIVS